LDLISESESESESEFEHTGSRRSAVSSKKPVIILKIDRILKTQACVQLCACVWIPVIGDGSFVQTRSHLRWLMSSNSAQNGGGSYDSKKSQQPSVREVIFVGQIAQTAQTYDLRHITPNSDTESSLNLRLQTKFNAFCKGSSQTYPYLIL
jgi:hypothetical protein